MYLTRIRAVPGLQLNAASRKSPEIQAFCIAKRRTLLNRKFVCLKEGAVIPHESRNSEEAIVFQFEFWGHHVKTEFTEFSVQNHSLVLTQET